MDWPNLSSELTPSANLCHSLWCAQVGEQEFTGVACTCGAEEAEARRVATVKDAARYRWWCRWWFDEKDDMGRINDLEYEGDDQASMSAAIDAEIAKDSKPEEGTSP